MLPALDSKKLSGPSRLYYAYVLLNRTAISVLVSLSAGAPGSPVSLWPDRITILITSFSRNFAVLQPEKAPPTHKKSRIAALRTLRRQIFEH